jgi:hypothetical protein
LTVPLTEEVDAPGEETSAVAADAEDDEDGGTDPAADDKTGCKGALTGTDDDTGA